MIMTSVHAPGLCLYKLNPPTIHRQLLREREAVVLIAPHEEGMVLYKLRNPQELRKISDVPQLEKTEVSKDELKLSISLVESMATSLGEVDVQDKYRDALRELIEAKVAGKQIVSVQEEEKPVVDIMTALRESIEKTKAQKKPMEKAKGAKKEAAEAKPAKQKKQVA